MWSLALFRSLCWGGSIELWSFFPKALPGASLPTQCIRTYQPKQGYWMFGAWVIMLDQGIQGLPGYSSDSSMVTAVASSCHLFHCFEVGRMETQGQGFLQTMKSKPEGTRDLKDVLNQTFSGLQGTHQRKCLRAFPPCPRFVLCNFAHNESLMKGYLIGSGELCWDRSACCCRIVMSRAACWR